MYMHASVVVIYIYIYNMWICLLMCILACLIFCIELYVLALWLQGKLYLSPLQASAVVQPLMHLQIVNEMAQVKPLNLQQPTPVTQGTLCKETTSVPAWPVVIGAEGHQHAIVSCLQSDTL